MMEWVEGQRLSDGGVTPEDLRMVEVGVYCSLSQLLDSGFYHADPHPGNLLRTPDGKLAYLGEGSDIPIRGGRRRRGVLVRLWERTERKDAEKWGATLFDSGLRLLSAGAFDIRVCLLFRFGLLRPILQGTSFALCCSFVNFAANSPLALP